MTTLKVTSACLLFILMLAFAPILPARLASWAHYGAAARLAQGQPVPATIIRTIVFRQISNFQSGGNVGGVGVMRMSADGSKLVFISGQKVFTMDTTGANLREIFVNPNPATKRAPDWVDISANGAKVLWAAGNFEREFFVANSDGSNRATITPTFQNRFGTNESLGLVLNPRLTADGSRVYFIHTGSADVSGGYRVNADGAGLTRLFSYLQLAQLFGRDGSEYNGNIAFRGDFDISDDGSRLVFGTVNFGGNGHLIGFDGAALRRIADFVPSDSSHRLVISGDGRRVVAQRFISSSVPAPGIAINFDGSNQQTILNDLGNNASYFGELTANGAQVLSVSEPYSLTLANTDGSGRVDLIIRADCDTNLFQEFRAPAISLSADGRRFVFRTAVPGEPQQIWIGDIFSGEAGPSSTGDAPRINEVAFNPNYVTADGQTASTFTARATDAQGGQSGLRRRLCSNALRNNAYEFRYLRGGVPFGIALFDDGANGGDQTANDGLFTQTQVRRDTAPPDPVTPLQIRHHAIATSLRQVTAVDATPFFVLSQPPGGAAPMLISITPPSGAAGIQVKLIGTGFDPVAANNVVLFGNRQARVLSATSDGTMLEVFVPPDLAAGVVPVTVTVRAQTSNAVNFTVTSGGTPTPTPTGTPTPTPTPGPGNCLLTPISIGETKPGALSNTDCFSPIDGPGFYADFYRFTSGANQAVAVTLTTPAFDAFLRLFDANGNVLQSNDDGGGGTNARIPPDSGFVTLPAAGTYLIEVSSFDPNTFGNYTVSLTAPNIQPTPTPSPTPQLCPTVSGINPQSGLIGSTVTITGANFTGVTSVRFFNNVAAQFTINSPTQITAVVPVGAVNGPIDVLKPSCPDAFSPTFTITRLCPTITNINPSSGQAGSTVLITGTNFTGVDGVRFFNNVIAPFTIISDTQISATVPASAVTGAITVFKPFCPDTNSGAPFSVTQPGPCIGVSIPTNLTGGPNSTLTVPINVSDTTGRNALSYDAVLMFDPAVLRLQNQPYDRTGTLSANLNVTTNSPTAGRLNISGFSSNPLTGAGVLLNLKFDIIGSLNACSDLNWTSFRFNEGTPCATTTNGRACVTGGGSITGTVNYCASTPPKPVPGVTISAAGTPAGSATTDNAGNYQLPNLGAGPYTLTPAKTGDANGITSFDAAQIAQHVVQIITLNGCQQVAADTSGNGEITSFDAAFIAQYVVGLTNPANLTGTWKFTPPTRSYTSLNGNQTAQNFDAVLLGELTGNWTPGGNALADASFQNRAASPAQQVSIALPTLTAAQGSSLTLPITVGNLSGQNVIAYDLDLVFDQTVLQLQSTPFDAAGTLSSNMTLTANPTPGRLRLSAFGTQALAGSGTLLNLKFTVTGVGGTSLTWQRFLLNETVQTGLTNGRINSARVVATVSAASFLGQQLAPESIVAAFGESLATSIASSDAVPLPTMLSGTTVRVRDSNGLERLAPLFFVAPQQINFLVPLGTAAGTATITVTSGNGTVSLGNVTIATVAPGLFTANANGQGVPAAVAVRVKADGTQSFELIARLDAATGRLNPAPIDLGPAGEQVVLVFFGTGLRGRSNLMAVSCQFGGVTVPVSFAGAQGDLVGLDQLNLGPLPRELAGRGEMDVVLIVDGKAANTVRVNIK